MFKCSKLISQLIFGLCFSSVSLFANECLFEASGADTNEWQTDGNIKIIKDEENTDKSCSVVQGYAQIISKELIPVNVSKTYRLSGWFRSAGTGKGRLFLGIMCYNNKEELIGSSHVGALPGTETELTAPVKDGDSSIEIKNGEKWEELFKDGKLKYASVAFNVDDSGNLNDLPNFNIHSYRQIENIEKKGDSWQIQLLNPIEEDFPLGAKVRLHTAGRSHLYCIAVKTLPEGWKEYAARLHGETKFGDKQGEFRKGTAFVRILMLVNYETKTKDTVTCFQGIKFEELE